MYPTYKNGELHIYSTDISNITYGDVVIFKNSQQTNNCIYIKRVVALSGDEFSCDGTVYSLNGKVLVEKYINSNISKPYNFDYIVPDNYIYVCGDNRDESYDSREFGAINKNDVIGIIEY
jgi:signal peptidase I